MITSNKIAEVFKINPPTPGDPCELTQLFGASPEWYATIGLPGHNGLDFRAKSKTAVYAVCDGTVTRVENGDVNDTTTFLSGTSLTEYEDMVLAVVRPRGTVVDADDAAPTTKARQDYSGL